jgi:hypothetical protein
VFGQSADDVELHGHGNAQCRLMDKLRGPAYAVDANVVAGVRLEDRVQVGLLALAVAALEHLEERIFCSRGQDAAVLARRKESFERGRVEFKASPSWIERATREAERRGLNLSAWIRMVVSDHLEKLEADRPLPPPQRKKKGN